MPPPAGINVVVLAGSVTVGDPGEVTTVAGISVIGETTTGKKVGTATAADGTYKLSSSDGFKKITLTGAGLLGVSSIDEVDAVDNVMEPPSLQDCDTGGISAPDPPSRNDIVMMEPFKRNIVPKYK